MKTEFVRFDLNEVSRDEAAKLYHSQLCFATTSQFRKVGYSGEPAGLEVSWSGHMVIYGPWVGLELGLELIALEERRNSPDRYLNLRSIGGSGWDLSPTEDRSYLVPVSQIAGLYEERELMGRHVRFVAVVPDELLEERPDSLARV